MLEFYYCIHDLCSALCSALLPWVSKAILCANALKQGCSPQQLAILSWLISMATMWLFKPSYARSSCLQHVENLAFSRLRKSDHQRF